MAQKQLYSGQFNNALKSALRLGEYESELDKKKIYTIIVIAAYYNKSYRQCYRAFVKLQNVENITEEEREIYEQIAVSLLINITNIHYFYERNPPIDGPCEQIACFGNNCTKQVSEFDSNCKACKSRFSPCFASGRPILQKEFYECKNCCQKMIESEVQTLKLSTCAFCQTPIDQTVFGVHETNI